MERLAFGGTGRLPREARLEKRRRVGVSAVWRFEFRFVCWHVCPTASFEIGAFLGAPKVASADATKSGL
jgi:hypothetical protein